MLEYARQSMCDYLSQTQPAPARLDDFNVFKKGNAAFTYGNFYNSYEMCTEPEPDADNVYYNLLNFRDYRHDAGNWRSKVMDQWNPDDTVEWVYDCALSCGFNELDIPFHNFRIYGSELRNMTRLDIIGLVAHHHQDSEISNTIGNTIYNRLEEIRRSVLKYADSSSQIHSHEQTMTNLDDWRGTASDYKPNNINLMPTNYGDDYEDPSRYTASPADSAGSDGSKSGDEDDKRKPSKRPPGRPKGTGTKKDKRPRNVSVPQFLRDLLLNERFCPSIIKWEDHSQGKFRFVKPDEVAKLWGQMKQNDNMTFEKFSRAMRYHYQHSVLVSVPTARLVYQFGPKGPEFKTSNPNFVKVKSELDSIHS